MPFANLKLNDVLKQQKGYKRKHNGYAKDITLEFKLEQKDPKL